MKKINLSLLILYRGKRWHKYKVTDKKPLHDVVILQLTYKSLPLRTAPPFFTWLLS